MAGWEDAGCVVAAFVALAGDADAGCVFAAAAVDGDFGCAFDDAAAWVGDDGCDTTA